MKQVLIIMIFFCISMNSKGQNTSMHWKLDCDTITFSGYVITLAHKSALYKRMSTYFAYIPDSVVNNDEAIKALVINNKKDHYSFEIINKHQYEHVLGKLFLPVIYDNGLMDEIITKSNCSEQLKYDKIFPDFYNGDRPSLPSITDVGHSNSFYPRFYYCNIKKFVFRGIVLTYDSYKDYFTEQVLYIIHGTPKSHDVLFYGKYRIIIRKIHSYRKQSKYRIILPYKLLETIE